MSRSDNPVNSPYRGSHGVTPLIGENVGQKKTSATLVAQQLFLLLVKIPIPYSAMAHTFSSLLYHAVWSTKNRLMLITDNLKPRLYGYIINVLEERGARVIIINGMPDHVHVLMQIKPVHSASELLRDVKTASSKWVRNQFSEQRNFGWQDGFGVFSVAVSTMPTVKAYIENQQQHHQGKSFETEFIEFLRKHQLEFDKKYVFD